MQRKKFLDEKRLAKLAKETRTRAHLTKAELARRLGVTRGTIHQAEEYPEMSLTRLRIRMIEKCGPFKISGPFYLLEKRG